LCFEEKEIQGNRWYRSCAFIQAF